MVNSGLKSEVVTRKDKGSVFGVEAKVLFLNLRDGFEYIVFILIFNL